MLTIAPDNSNIMLNNSEVINNGNSSKHNIQVMCRVRPLNSREIADNSTKCLHVKHDSCLVAEV
jgi:hypothetical protein